MSRTLQRHWVAVARTGGADRRGEAAWPRHRPGAGRLMNFTEHGPIFAPHRQRIDLVLRAGLKKAGDLMAQVRGGAGNLRRAEHSNPVLWYSAGGRDMKRLRGIALGCLLAVSSAAAAAHTRLPAGRPAIWRTYDMDVDLQNLPRTYTCDQLWYVFHGILLRLGVPIASLNVLPYRCSTSPTGDMRSPHVQVSFRMPAVVQGAAVKWSELSAVRRLVLIRPGEPKKLQAGDCRLLRQIRETLLASLPVQVVHSSLRCGAGAPFSVTVRTWVAAAG